MPCRINFVSYCSTATGASSDGEDILDEADFSDPHDDSEEEDMTDLSLDPTLGGIPQENVRRDSSAATPKGHSMNETMKVENGCKRLHEKMDACLIGDQWKPEQWLVDLGD